MSNRDIFFPAVQDTDIIYLFACIILYINLSMLHTHTHTHTHPVLYIWPHTHTKSGFHEHKVRRSEQTDRARSAAKKVCGLGKKQTELPGSVSVSVSTPP